MTTMIAPRDTTMQQIARDREPVTPKQRAFIEKLLGDRDTTGTAYEGWQPDWSRATKKLASQVIDYLLTLPAASLSTPTPAPSPAENRWGSIPVGPNGYGYYALETGPEQISFFRVRRPKEGSWAGKTFIDQQAGDNFYPVEPRQRGYAYLTEIASDPHSAGSLYGQQIGQCYRCHRTLTDTESRAAGIGPDCREKV